MLFLASLAEIDCGSSLRGIILLGRATPNWEGMSGCTDIVQQNLWVERAAVSPGSELKVFGSSLNFLNFQKTGKVNVALRGMVLCSSGRINTTIVLNELF